MLVYFAVPLSCTPKHLRFLGEVHAMTIHMQFLEAARWFGMTFPCRVIGEWSFFSVMIRVRNRHKVEMWRLAKSTENCSRNCSLHPLSFSLCVFLALLSMFVSVSVSLSVYVLSPYIDNHLCRLFYFFLSLFCFFRSFLQLSIAPFFFSSSPFIECELLFILC